MENSPQNDRGYTDIFTVHFGRSISAMIKCGTRPILAHARPLQSITLMSAFFFSFFDMHTRSMTSDAAAYRAVKSLINSALHDLLTFKSTLKFVNGLIPYHLTSVNSLG